MSSSRFYWFWIKNELICPILQHINHWCHFVCMIPVHWPVFEQVIAISICFLHMWETPVLCLRDSFVLCLHNSGLFGTVLNRSLFIGSYIDLLNVSSACHIEVILWYNSGGMVAALKKSLFQSTLQCTQQWDIKSHLRPDEFSVHVSDPSWQSVSRQTVSHVISFCWNLLSDSIEILRNWEILGLQNSKWRSTYFMFLIWLIWCVIR